MESKKSVFKGIKIHTISTFPLLRNERKESLKYTLGLIEGPDDTNVFPRTTHLYKSNIELLEDIVRNITLNTNFYEPQIVHESSDLGLTYKIIAKHKEGSTLIFDGLYFRVTKILYSEPFNMQDLLPLTGVPRDEYHIIRDFITQCIKPSFPEESEYGHPLYSYYTIDETNWEEMGLKREGDAQARLILNDPNYFTITAIIFAKRGKEFGVHVGEEDKINQMIAHDFFIMTEIQMYSGFFNENLKSLLNFQNEFKDCYNGAFEPFWKLSAKKKKWSRMKEIQFSLYEIMELIELGKLYSKVVEKLIENKIAFFNGPRQLWISGEERDSEEKIQHQISNFFEFRVEENKLKQISEKPIKPFYSHDISDLEQKLDKITTLVNDLYGKQKDLLSIYQTEFALDAIIIATVAIILTFITAIGDYFPHIMKINFFYWPNALSGIEYTLKVFFHFI